MSKIHPRMPVILQTRDYDLSRSMRETSNDLPMEVVGWLDEDADGSGNHDVGLVFHRIWSRLEEQKRPRAEIEAVLRVLAPLDCFVHGKEWDVWKSVFSPKHKANPGDGTEEYPKLSELDAS